MPSNLSDVQITDAEITVTSGLFDTDDGIKLRVAGDSYPRVHLTPQGEVKTGSGTAAPTAGPAVHSGEFTQGEGYIYTTIADTAGAYYIIDEFSPEGDGAVAFIVADFTTPGSFTAVLRGIDAGVSSYAISDLQGSQTTIIGPGPSSFPATGAVIHAVNDGNGWVMAPSSTRTTAEAADFTPPGGSGWFTATTVQDALIQIFNYVD